MRFNTVVTESVSDFCTSGYSQRMAAHRSANYNGVGAMQELHTKKLCLQLNQSIMGQFVNRYETYEFYGYRPLS
jgi:hypothetical protein